MELERTTTEASVAIVDDAGIAPDLFGSRPSTGRPHSMNLFGAAPAAGRNGAARGVDVLLGIGIGAAMMYYLDPERGAPRRALVRDKVVHLVTMAPDAFEGLAREAHDRLAEAVAAGRERAPADMKGAEVAAGRAVRAGWTPTARLAAGAAGAALALLAGRRNDALGALVGLAGTALLARGVTSASPRVIPRPIESLAD